MSILLGAIADDFTGATDLANTLVRNGMSTLQVIGLPPAKLDTGDAEAVVVALKSRTAAADAAVRDSLAALHWLRAGAAQQILFKICSTFDSTPAGNIGPVANALADALGCGISVVCPAFPATGRTVYQGQLFVGSQLLAESPMRDHPLTPMYDSDLVRLMSEQAQRGCGLVPLQQVRKGVESARRALSGLRARGCRYAVCDAVDDSDLRIIGRALAGEALVIGSSAVAQALPGNFIWRNRSITAAGGGLDSSSGRALVLAGSCSAATRRQIGHLQSRAAARKIDVDALAAGRDLARDLTDWAVAQDEDAAVLIYASADPGEVAAIQQRHGVDGSGAMIEQLMGQLARALVARGFSRLVVAGGETAGAVVSALDIRALRIGSEIDPGVPWTQAVDSPKLWLALKSGNFGGDDFFSRAFEVLG